MQGTEIWSLVQEDPTYHGATKPMCHNYWTCALEPTCCSYWAHVPQVLNPRAATTEACLPRSRAPQQEKPPQWEAETPQRRVDLARRNWRKPAQSNEDPTQPKIIINNNNNNKVNVIKAVYCLITKCLFFIAVYSFEYLTYLRVPVWFHSCPAGPSPWTTAWLTAEEEAWSQQ